MDTNEKNTYTAEEMQEAIEAAVKAKNAEKMRKWWGKQTPEERKARRQRYAINALKRAGMLDKLEKECGE